MMIKPRTLRNLLLVSLMITVIIYLAKINQIEKVENINSESDEATLLEPAAENEDKVIQDMEEEVDRCAKRLDGEFENELFDFEAFDNKKGAQTYVVPNIVHTIYLNQTLIEFDYMITLYSIFLNHNPARIYIHCDNCSFHGPYWKQILSTRCLKDKIVLHQVTVRERIFGNKIELIQHRSDIIKALILMKYGGIYLDNDIFVVNSLDKYRKYEMTVGWNVVHESIGNQVLIANSHARFLNSYFDQYRYKYDKDSLDFNSALNPAQILIQYDYIAHLVEKKFGLNGDENMKNLYEVKWSEWQTMDTIRLMLSNSTKNNEQSIKANKRTIDEMYLDIIKRIKSYISETIIEF